jgi:hypothetical protein
LGAGAAGLLVPGAAGDLVSGGYGALVEDELPAVVAEDPERGVVGGRVSGGDVVGRQGHARTELGDVEVAHRGGAGGAGEKGVGELLEIEDAAGGAELSEIMGQKLGEGGAVGLAIRVEEALFQGMEVLLELSRGHGALTDVQFGGRVSWIFFLGGREGFSRVFGGNGVLGWFFCGYVVVDWVAKVAFEG